MPIYENDGAVAYVEEGAEVPDRIEDSGELIDGSMTTVDATSGDSTSGGSTGTTRDVNDGGTVRTQPSGSSVSPGGETVAVTDPSLVPEPGPVQAGDGTATDVDPLAVTSDQTQPAQVFPREAKANVLYAVVFALFAYVAFKLL